MKASLFCISLFFMLIRGSLSDCTQDQFCTSCAGVGASCAMCTYTAAEATRFMILQPNGTCYADDPTRWQEGIIGSALYICNDGCNLCQSGGVCGQCESIYDYSTSYRQYVIPFNGGTYCTHDCGLFPGYYNGTASCTSKCACAACPAGCFNCSSSTICQDCSYSIPRFNGLASRFNTSFSQGTTGSSGALLCNQSVTRNTTFLSLTFYLSPDPGTCSHYCSGNFSQPFDDLNDILFHLVAANGADIYSYYEVELTILLLNGITTNTHYWVYNASLPNQVYYAFNRVSAQVTIQPAVYSATGTCNNPELCFPTDSNGDLTSMPIVMWKNPYLKFYVTRSLTIQNIIFDGADIVTYGSGNALSADSVLLTAALTTKGRFCLDETTTNGTSTTINLVPNPAYDESQVCMMPADFYSPLNIPLEFTLETYGGAFFVMSFLSDYANASIPQLSILNCNIRNFWYMTKTKSFISMDLWASYVTIYNTTFRNFMFIDGIITNTNNIFLKSFVLNKNIHDNRYVYTCLRFNSSYGNCHSVNISNSVFDSYNALPNSFALPGSLTKPLNYKMGVEAFIMRVRSLEGPIVITGNTFKNFITLKRDSFYVETNSTDSQTVCLAASYGGSISLTNPNPS